MLKGYRTVIFNVIMGVISVIRAVSPETEVPTAEAVDQFVGTLDLLIVAGWAMGNIVLRFLTTTSIFMKDEKK